jgi:hypothetical protein
MGLKQGEAQYSGCVASLTDTVAATENSRAKIALVDAVQPVAADGLAKNYFEADATQRNREVRYSCAKVGMVPGSVAFGSCVSNLIVTLFDIDHPAN